MDMVEFAEKFMNVELKEWQKNHIRILEKLPPHTDVRIVMGRHGRVYIYMSPKTQKELTQYGPALNHYHKMSIMREPG